MKKVTTAILFLTLFSFNLLSVNAQGTGSEGINLEKAKQIALQQVKGEIVKTHLEENDGKSIFEITIQAKDGKYEVEIDKSTGKVLEVEKEGDHGNDDDHDDDHDDDDDDDHDDDHDDDDRDDQDEPNDD
ncbi:PepSY domain-containing protein [Bacillus benzoevorans]|uniref:PepSY domain-containing protein n=1 Tax=Bacillus benzoevorans TaxID=1456 RepID=UPI003670EBB4